MLFIFNLVHSGNTIVSKEPIRILWYFFYQVLTYDEVWQKLCNCDVFDLAKLLPCAKKVSPSVHIWIKGITAFFISLAVISLLCFILIKLSATCPRIMPLLIIVFCTFYVLRSAFLCLFWRCPVQISSLQYLIASFFQFWGGSYVPNSSLSLSRGSFYCQSVLMSSESFLFIDPLFLPVSFNTLV